MLRIRLGWDPDENVAHVVSDRSVRATTPFAQIDRLAQQPLESAGIYTRPTERRDGRWWDTVSGAPMSTTHAIARFFVPHIEGYRGTVLFADGDILVRKDLAYLFAQADPSYAVQVVQHPPQTGDAVKKDGAPQAFYARKNWSSVMLMHCDHPAWRRLTLADLNGLPGRDLHAFCWLYAYEIGELDPRWNHLVGVSAPEPNPWLVHYTLGTPNVVPGDQPFAEEWWQMARRAGYRLPSDPDTVSRETSEVAHGGR